MSSILDALKKSQAQHQRGQFPTLGSHLPSYRRPQPKRRRTWLPLAVLATLVLAWYGGLFDPPGSLELASQPTSEPAGSDSADVVADNASTHDDAITATAAEAHADAPPATASSTAPAPPVPGWNRPGAAPATAAPRTPATPAAEAPAQSQAAAPPRQPPAATNRPAASPAPASAQPPATPASAQPRAATASTANRPAPAKPNPTPAAPAIQTASELPFSTRRNLPEITISLHVYNDDPDRRFAIINGVRVPMKEGNSLDGGLEFVAIRPDGIVLRHSGTQFLQPIRP